MTILPFAGPSSIVKTRLPSHFARSGHIYDIQDICQMAGERDLENKISDLNFS